MQLWFCGIAQPRLGSRRHSFTSRPSGKCDQGDITFAGGNGLSRVGNVDQIGGAAGFGRIDMPQPEVQILRHGQRPQPRSIAGTEVAIDILTPQSSICQRSERDLGMQLSDRFVWGPSGRVLEDANDIGLIAHRSLTTLANSIENGHLSSSGRAGFRQRPVCWQYTEDRPEAQLYLEDPMRTHFNDFGQPVGFRVEGWSERARPPRWPIPGRWCRIEPLDCERHSPTLCGLRRSRRPPLDLYGYGPFGKLEGYWSASMERTCRERATHCTTRSSTRKQLEPQASQA